MGLTANVRLYGPTDQTDGVQLTVDHNFGRIADADAIDETRIRAYFDLDYPGDYKVHGQSSSALDVTGTLDDFRALAREVQSFVDNNTETEDGVQPTVTIAGETRDQIVELLELIDERWRKSPSLSASQIERAAMALLTVLNADLQDLAS